MEVIIVEDEVMVAKNLISLLKKKGGIDILACLETIRETVDWFEKNPFPDLVFMDIHLADGSAFEIFEKVQFNCPVIFTTAYDEHALEAFKVNSIDYLLKPLNPEDVNRALDKYHMLHPRNEMDWHLNRFIMNLKGGSSFTSGFLIPGRGDKLIPLSTSNIAYIHLVSTIAWAVDFEGKEYSLPESMDKAMLKLDPGLFFRTNRQFIVSRKAIRDIDLWFSKRLAVNLIVEVPERIIVSRARCSDFRKWLTGDM